MGSPLRLCVVAGETSGDAHAGGLVGALLEKRPDASWFGAGGPALTARGVEILVPMERLSVVGVAEVVSRLPDLWRAMGTLKKALRDDRPDALVLVDFPDFNFRLAKYAHGMGIPVIYYITPQVWAWRPGRTEFLRRNIRRALVILPFEEAFLRARGVDAVFVGHPLAEASGPPSSRAAFLGRHGIAAEGRCVALLPGSRRSEVSRNLPALLGAAHILAPRFPTTRFFVPWAPSLQRQLPPKAGPVEFVDGEYLDILGHADAAAVASGTACLEAALLGVPSAVVYRLQPLSYAIGRKLVKVPFVALPNVILGRQALPELIQGEFLPARVADLLGGYLNAPETSRERALALAWELRSALGGGDAYGRAAAEVLRAVSGEA